ncbi:MAG: HupE/UreJ family protein [Planctomycetes bacterium]|nr:HupE/UreJ family protein [Planctomycetota bacterium]
MLLSSLALLLAASGAHPNSLSRTEIRVTGSVATVELGFQALSLLEVLPELERVRDGILDAEESAASQPVIETYLLERLRLARVVDGREELLSGRLVALTPQDPAGLGAFDLQRVDARLVFEAPEALEHLVVESRLFHETNPWHQDFTTLNWNEDAAVPHTFGGDDTRWRFEPAHVRRPGVLALFFRLGIEHILHGYDHQAFLLALLVAARRVRSLVGVVTAFTLAHSLSLALAALGVVHVPSRFVELAIALSIAYVACDNLLRRAARDPWLEAFAFGLLHGLGFAGFLADALAGEPLIVTALFGFNLGVEAGQLVLVLVCVLLFALLFRRRHLAEEATPAPGLVPPVVRASLSVLVALAGFYWFFERAGWLPWA